MRWSYDNSYFTVKNYVDIQLIFQLYFSHMCIA